MIRCCSCFGFTLQKNVQILSVIEVIIALASLVFGTIGLLNVWNHRRSLLDDITLMPEGDNSISSFDLEWPLEINDDAQAQDQNSTLLWENSSPAYPSAGNPNATGENSEPQIIYLPDHEYQLIIAMIAIIILTVHIAFYAVNLALGLFLFYATIKRSREHCHAWFTITIVLWVITLILFTINMMSTMKGHDDIQRGKSHLYFSTITTLFNLLYKLYVLWVVRNYVNLLRVNNTRHSIIGHDRNVNTAGRIMLANEEDSTHPLRG